MNFLIVLVGWGFTLLAPFLTYYGIGYLWGGPEWLFRTWLFNRRNKERRFSLGTRNQRGMGRLA